MYKIVLLADYSEEYFKNLLKGINQYSRNHGTWLFCRMPLFYRETIGVKGILEWAREWEANGIIGTFYNNPEVNRFIEAGMPVIAQDFKERFSEIPNITGGYKETGIMGADYFLKKGYKHFAFYGYGNIVWSRERSQGFEHRINEAGYEVQYFEHRKSRSNELWYYKPSSLSNWLESLPKPIALMACDDNQGQHITEACKHAGFRIPDDVAVLGVDNDTMICDLCDPPLSSISLNTEKAGFEAAQLMDHMIVHGPQDHYDVIVKPTQIVTRQSTDIYATNDKYISSALIYIHQNIDKNLKVDDVVMQVPLSRRSLEKRFQNITGYPVYEYIFNLRIEKFTQKLLETDMTIFEIALDLGLNDSKNIARQFKQVKGCTPVEYRKRHLIGK